MADSPAGLVLIAGLAFMAIAWPMASLWRPDRPDGIVIHLFVVWVTLLGLLVLLARTSRKPTERATSSTKQEETG